MLTIDVLDIRLPAGFEGRADSIARLAASALGRAPLTGDLRVARLAVPPVDVPPNASDAVIAARIAGAILAALPPAAGPHRQGGA